MLCCIVLYIHEIFFQLTFYMFSVSHLICIPLRGTRVARRCPKRGRRTPKRKRLAVERSLEPGRFITRGSQWMMLDSLWYKRLRKNSGLNHYASNGKTIYKTHDFDAVIGDSKLLVITRVYPHLLSIFDWIFQLKQSSSWLLIFNIF